MSAAAAEILEGVPVVKSGKKKLILIGVIALVVLALVGGGVAYWLKKRAAHAAELAVEEEGGGKALAEHKVDPSHPPTFLPLEPFVVNLADRDADRYAQIGITLELESPAFAEQMKGFMPAVRNAILMVIAHKSAKELLDRSGKEELADEILREAGRPMGIEVDPPLRLKEVVVTRIEPISTSAAPSASSSASAPPAAMAQAPAAAGESASASAMAAASAAVAVSAVVHVANLAAAPHTETPKAHGDASKVHGDASSGPIRHVHFSSFIIQ